MIVLDTHVILWLAEIPQKLSPAAKDAINAARKQGSIAISDKSLWELTMMMSRGILRSKITTRDFLESVERNFAVLPISGAIAERAVQFSSRYPKDPTDRIIGATALVHGFSLVTVDGPIRKSGEVPCIW